MYFVYVHVCVYICNYVCVSMCVYVCIYLYVRRGTGTYLTQCAHRGQRAIRGF